MSDKNIKEINNWLQLALNNWSMGELDAAKKNLFTALSLSSNPQKDFEETYLNFAAIFPSWLDLLLESKVPMDHILNGQHWHSRQFLENEDVTLKFFQTYPDLLDAFVEGDVAQVYDEDDENFEITLNWLPMSLREMGGELLLQYGYENKQVLNFMNAYKIIKGLSWSDPNLEKALNLYVECQNLEEDECQKIQALFSQKKLEETLPSTSNVSNKPKI